MTSVPSLTRVEQRSGKSRGLRRQNAYALDAMGEGFAAGVEFGQHAAGDDLLLFECRDLREREPAHDVAVGSFDARNVGEEDEGVGLGADGAGGGHLVGVDVVVLAVEAERDRRDDRDRAHGPDGFEPRGSVAAISPTKPRSGLVFFLRARKTWPSPPERPTAAWP